MGVWSAGTVCLVGVAYAVTLAFGVAVHGLDEPIGDPVLAVMEVLTLMSALPMVVLMAAVQDYAPVHRTVYGVVALAFTALFAGTTTVVHVVGLTAGRQTGTGAMVWPSAAYAAELVAWDLFLGAALLFAALVFEGGGLARSVRRGLTVAGALCVLGLFGPATGDMRVQWVGVAGYAVALPVVCFLLARLFHGGRG